MITIQDAVKSLRPSAEWTMSGNDVTGIEWHTEGVEPVTQAEAEAEVLRLESQEAEKAADKAAGLRKLAQASGLSEAEIAALIG